MGGKVIAEAHNGPREHHDPTAHAEILAIRRAAETLGDERLTDCELWVTLEPCAMCAGAIVHARIGKLYYAASDPKGGAVEHGARVFEQPQCLHRPEVYSGMGEGQGRGAVAGVLQGAALSSPEADLKPSPDFRRHAVACAVARPVAGGGHEALVVAQGAIPAASHAH